MSATGLAGAILIEWVNALDRDLKAVEIWASATNDRAAATRRGTATAGRPGTKDQWIHSGLATGTTLYYWVRSVDTSANVSTFTPDDPLDGWSATVLATPGVGLAKADDLTMGIATFHASDFDDNDASPRIISIDYENGQASTGGTKGFLTAADWSTFNNKVPPERLVQTLTGLVGGGDLYTDRYLSIDGTVVTLTGTQTLTNKRITPRVVTLPDNTFIVPSIDTADVLHEVNTHTTGGLIINTPFGTPTDGQFMLLRIKGAVSHALTWSGAYRGETIPLPLTTTGGGLTDYWGFHYHSGDARWDFTIIGSASVTLSTPQTFTNKRLVPRAVSIPTAATITPSADTTDFMVHVNTGAALTIAAPTGTPTDGQPLDMRITCTGGITFTWNAIYRGSTAWPLPTLASGASRADYLFFRYHLGDTKWDLVLRSLGY